MVSMMSSSSPISVWMSSRSNGVMKVRSSRSSAWCASSSAECSSSRIFERFYRAERSRSRDMGGTGLGLSIVKHIMQAHGGVVEVQSAPGQGSTFRLKFPISTEEAPETSGSSPSPGTPGEGWGEGSRVA